MPDLTRREFLAAGAALAAMPACPEGGLGPSRAALAQEADGLVVHEWGVATIPYGAPGASLRTAGATFRGGLEQIPGLPAFVMTWEAVVKDDIEEWKNRPVPVTKPIVYFYSKKKTALSLTVKFPDGRPNAWFPAADDYAPAPNFGKGVPSGPGALVPKNGRLSWNLTLDPDATPTREADGWWKTARKVDAVAVCREKECEKFVFYDGLADFNPRAEVAWTREGTVTIRNASRDPFPAVVAIRVKDGVCSSARATLAKEASETLTLKPGLPDLAPLLKGLYPKESGSLVEIWTEEFFKAEGVRVLVALSRDAIERLLPMEIKPAPTELARVLIVHLECLDDDRIRKIKAWIADFAAAEIEPRDFAAKKLRELGPLAEPFIREAAEKASDAEVKSRLLDLLKR
jgi:hypothetical protein